MLIFFTSTIVTTTITVPIAVAITRAGTITIMGTRIRVLLLETKASTL